MTDQFDGAFSKKNAKAGTAGEQLYLRMLGASKLTRGYVIRHRLAHPQENGVRTKGDVDFAVVNGDVMLLVDVKMWAEGRYWCLGDILMKDFFPHVKNAINEVTGRFELSGLRVSRNMEVAKARYARKFPSMKIATMTVFVGTRPDVAALQMRSSPTYLGKESLQVISSVLWPAAEVRPEVLQLLDSLDHDLAHGKNVA